MRVDVDEDALKLGLSIETLSMENISVRPSRREAFRGLSGELKLEMRGRFHTMDDVREDRTIRSLRGFYWKIGIDPTRTRPSSEALLRRLLRNDIPSINNLVDAGNLASAKTLIPVGIYDVERIISEPILKLASGGEEFTGIGGSRSVLDRGVPVISDDEGVFHLYPHKDSTRTMVTERCTSALVIACGAPGIRNGQMRRTLDEVLYYWRQLKE